MTVIQFLSGHFGGLSQNLKCSLVLRRNQSVIVCPEWSPSLPSHIHRSPDTPGNQGPGWSLIWQKKKKKKQPKTNKKQPKSTFVVAQDKKSGILASKGFSGTATGYMMKSRGKQRDLLLALAVAIPASCPSDRDHPCHLSRCRCCADGGSAAM